MVFIKKTNILVLWELLFLSLDWYYSMEAKYFYNKNWTLIQEEFCYFYCHNQNGSAVHPISYWM